MRTAKRVCLLAVLSLGLLAATAQAGVVNQWSLEEGPAGADAIDSVGGQNAELQPTGNPAVWVADPAPVPSGSTWSLRFDGTEDIANALGYTGITGTDPRSMSAWIKTSSKDMEPIISWGQNQSGKKWTFRVQGAPTGDGPKDGTIRIEVSGGYHVGTTDVADGDWHHVACTLADDGSPNVNETRLWVDGQLEGRGAVQGQAINTASNANVRIGCAVQSGRFFDGNIDEVLVYDEAVDRSTIRALAGLAPDPYFETVKAAAPVAYWRLGEPSGNRAFNEGSLGSAADGAYNGDTILGEPGGAPGSTTLGTENTSVTFDGAGDYVQATGYKGITGTDPRTVSAWIKTDDSGNGPIVSWGTNSAGQKWNFRVQDKNGPAGTVRVEVNGGYQVGTTYVADGEWHHVAATWEDDGVNTNVNDVRLWVDGVLQGVGASQGQAINTASGTDVRIGRGIPTDDYFDGGIDEVQIYDRAMSRSEIRALAGLAPDPYYEAVQASKPIAYWRLGEASGTKAFNEGSLGAAVDGTYDHDAGAPAPVQGQPSLVPTITDTATYFSGSDGNRVVIPDHDALNTGSSYPQRSIEAWFSSEGADGRNVIVDEGGGDSGFNLYVHNDDGDEYLRFGAWDQKDNMVNHFPTRVQIDENEAYYAVSTYDDATDTFVLYLNGAPVSSKVNANIEPIPQHGNAIAIGRNQSGTRFDNGTNSSSGEAFQGTIDEVAVYDTAVDLLSIQTHYVTGVGNPMTALGLRPRAALGVLLNYDATFDTDGNDAWEDTIGTRPGRDGNQATPNRFDFALGGAPRVAVSSSVLPLIYNAYDFDGTGGATCREPNDIAGDPTRFSASFELVFKPDDFLGQEVIADIGGRDNGTAFWLDDSILHFDAKSGSEIHTQFDLATLPQRQQDDFLHVIGVLDMDADEAKLYVNTLLRDSDTASLNAWAGGNNVGLGHIAENMAFDMSLAGFDGQIALFRIYGTALGAGDVWSNFDSLQPEPTTLALLGLGALALARRRRRRR